MTFHAVPWDGEEHDMYEADWRRYHLQWGDGLISVGSRIVSANDREFSISGMEGVIQGAYFRQVGTDSIMVPPPSSGQRYSQVALKYDPGANSVTLAVRHGGGGSNPIPPTPAQEPNGIWEMPIFEFGPAGDGALDSLPSTDLRTRGARVDYAPLARQREIFGLSARHGDLVYDDEFRWWRWDRNIGDAGGWVQHQTRWEPVSTSSAWDGNLAWSRVGRTIWLRGLSTRTANETSQSLLGTLPIAARPRIADVNVTAVMGSAPAQIHLLNISTGGQITLYRGTAAIFQGGTIRVYTSWPA